MKIRTDFVTNSSSSNFCCWKVESYDYIKISTHLKQFNGIYKSGNFELSAETDGDSLVFTRFVKGKELKLSNNEILYFYNLSEVLEYFDKTFKNNFDYSSCENNYDLYREKIYFDWDRKYVINDINIIFETAICAGFSNIFSYSEVDINKISEIMEKSEIKIISYQCAIGPCDVYL